MDYWESGMHLALGSDIFDSFVRYQTRLIREYNRLAREFSFTTVDARKPIDRSRAICAATSPTYLDRSKAAAAPSDAKARLPRCAA